MPFDGTNVNPTVAHLLRAKRYIINHGWCPNGAINDEDEVCIAVAISRTFESYGICQAAWVMCHALGVEPSLVDGHSIGKWNDTADRTFDEVLVAFDKAIELAMEETHAV